MRDYKSSEFVSAMLHSDVIRVVKEGKICIMCKEERVMNDFAKNPRAQDGRRNTCRKCSNDHNRIYKEAKKKEKDLYAQFMPI